MNEQWIPCYQKLPKDGQACLVTMFQKPTQSSSVELFYFEKRKKGNCFTNFDYDYSICDDVEETGVIAWMPVPEPYKIPDCPPPKLQNSNNQ